MHAGILFAHKGNDGPEAEKQGPGHTLKAQRRNQGEKRENGGESQADLKRKLGSAQQEEQAQGNKNQGEGLCQLQLGAVKEGCDTEIDES
ncbi:hypothetical protein SDC9_102074 [bioreactor metagenome]|uniref:Uncharacterized protein n=1 Tax=bioreactor metagenome TaxID=1076179 RepID=A0A645AQ98_9ZZZZ